MKNEIIKLALDNQADIVGFAPIERFDENDAIRKIMPNTKTVICLVFGLLRGSFRGIEEGTTYYQYTTMSVENMEETVMPLAQLKIANYIEEKGYTALPQRRHQTIMAESNDTNPEIIFDKIYRGVKAETQMNFIDSAVKCGVGEKGLHGALLTKKFGPLNRYCFILTDAVIEPDEVLTPSLCDKCGKCVKACPGKAISPDGKVDNWQCAVYYNGANGTKNPFMNPDAFKRFENRLDIISGNAKFDQETAREVLANIVFYPPAQHSYPCSICGRACDLDCYCHLEEKGVLERKYHDKFRKREKWAFDIKDFEV